MKKWVPYLVAVVVGLVVAVVAFGPGLSEPDRPDKTKTANAKPEKKVEYNVHMGADGTALVRPEGETRTPAEIVAEAVANPPPPAGTLRPMNEGEIAHKARLERPFNKHQAHTASFWNQAARLITSENPEIGRECSAMARYLRDQGNEDEIDAAAIVSKEHSLTGKIRGSGLVDVQLTGILTYIDASGQAVLDGVDPTTVPKPTKSPAGG